MPECIFCGKKYKRDSTFIKHYYEDKARFDEFLKSYSNMSTEEKQLFEKWKQLIDERFDKIYRQPDLILKGEIKTLQLEIVKGLKLLDESLNQRQDLLSKPIENKNYTDLDYNELKKRMGATSTIVVKYIQ